MASFVYSQLFVTPTYPTADQTGRTVIVTGSNVGLGLEAARHFTRLGAAKVILAVRDLTKGEAAKKSIEESTRREGVVEVWQLDLGSYESVKQFAKRVNNLPRVDVMLENAGLAPPTFKLMEDNESTITVNVVSTFLLALLVLPKLKETAQRYNTRPRLTIVSSEVHGWTNFQERKNEHIFEAINDKEKADMGSRYALSKLFEVFAVREICAKPRTMPDYPVIINTVNPGLCHSELARDLGWGLWLFKLLLARTTEVGSRTLVHAATAGRKRTGSISTIVTSRNRVRL